MAKYVGKRVVPKHCGAWTKNKEYEMLSIVLDEASGESYISRRVVPAGTLLTDEYYWSICSLFSQQIADMGEEFEERQRAITADNASTLRQIKADNDATEKAVKDDNDATETAIKNDNAATKQYVDAGLARTEADMEEAVSSVNATNQALNARMDGIASGATSDTEILDARTDAEGTAHATLGAHIRQADERIQGIYDHTGAMLHVPDDIRQKNLVKMLATSTTGTDGTTICRTEVFGPVDAAGVVVNGSLGDALGRTIFHISEPIPFEAGKTYTVILDDPQRTCTSSIFFYHATANSVLQENGVNKGFTINTLNCGQMTPDKSGSYRIGLYVHDFTFENYLLHIYIVEGAVSEEEFLSFVPYADTRKMLTFSASISDYARKNNMVHARHTIAMNNAGEVMVTVDRLGNLDQSVSVLNGQMRPSFSVLRTSQEFLIDEGETCGTGPFTFFQMPDDSGGAGIPEG